MKAELISIGTELLLGDIVNTNSAYLAKELSQLGIFCYHQVTIGDNPERLKEQLATSTKRADLIITTGGLGPTYDDLSKEMLAEFAGKKMILDEASLESIQLIFQKSGRKMTENNIKQAYLPEGATVFNNHWGTAPGFALEVDQVTVIMLPGPPREMSRMFENEVKPFLQKQTDTVLVSKVIHLFGIGESQLEAMLADYMQEMTNPTIAPYAKEGEVSLRITASATTNEVATQMIDVEIEKLQPLLNDYIYGIDIGTLEAAFAKKITGTGKLSILELGTTGILHHRLANLPNSGAFLQKTIIMENVEITNDYDPAKIREQLAEFTQNPETDMSICYAFDQKLLGNIHITIYYIDSYYEYLFNVERGYQNDLQRMRHVGASHALYEMLQIITDEE